MTMTPSSTTKGLFLTFEGVDGAGKSTHVQWVSDFLTANGVTVCRTREPGGTPLGEKLRELLLTEPMNLETETLLMFAARNEHLRTVIEPALNAGNWVVCDRFTDATFAYQGGGRAMGMDRVAALAQWVHPEFGPDRTWLFDVPLAVAKQRLADSRSPDRFEREQSDFFERTRAAYMALVAEDEARFEVVDGTQSIETIRVGLRDDLSKLMAQWRQAAAQT
ncbi:MAG: dTMP kinase [Orrella sp.]